MPQLEQSAKERAFHRMSFEIRDQGKFVRMHTLLINPGEMSFDEPARVNIQQTLGGAYVSDFGKGLPTVSITGTTGFAARRSATGKVRDGLTEWQAIRDDVYRYFTKSKSHQMEMYWFNWEEGTEFYKIQPQSLRLQRSKAQPLLFQYEFRFTCIAWVSSVLARENIRNREMADLIAGGKTIATAASDISEALSEFS